MDAMKQKLWKRKRRQLRARRRITGTAARPRLAINRTLKNLYAQVIDDEAGRTLAAASTRTADLKGALKSGGNCEAAKKLGELIGQRAKAAGIERVVFDRGGFLYHGRVKAVAEGARSAGLQF